MSELTCKFNQGTLDRELSEKVKSADENLTVHDWRFLLTLHGYRCESLSSAAH